MHKGMKASTQQIRLCSSDADEFVQSAAVWFFRQVAPQLVAYCNEHSTTALYIVGHSLGAATSAILTIMLLDFIDEFWTDKSKEFKLHCFGYAPACGLSLDLSEKYKVRNIDMNRTEIPYVLTSELCRTIYTLLYSPMTLLAN